MMKAGIGVTWENIASMPLPTLYELAELMQWEAKEQKRAEGRRR